MSRAWHVLGHLIVWRRCTCFDAPDPALAARLDGWALEWARMDHKARRDAFRR